MAAASLRHGCIDEPSRGQRLTMPATRLDGGAITGDLRDLGAEMLGTLPTRTGPADRTVGALR